MLVQDDEGGNHHLGNFRDGDSSGSDVFLACSEGMTEIQLHDRDMINSAILVVTRAAKGFEGS